MSFPNYLVLPYDPMASMIVKYVSYTELCLLMAPLKRILTFFVKTTECAYTN